MRADGVILINDDDDTAQVEVPSIDAPPLSIKVEAEDTPRDSNPESEAPRMSTRTRVQRKPFYPRRRTSITRLWDSRRQEIFVCTVLSRFQVDKSILTRLTDELNSPRAESYGESGMILS